jgi:arylsulfatase A-like enzyme
MARRAERRRAAAAALGGLAAAAIGALPAASCRGFDPGRPDVVLVVVDTLRADHLGVYGYDRPTSPRIDRLAAGGAVFENAWAAAPWTLPSVMSVVTGRYPSDHRVENDGLRLPAGVPTLAGTLRAAGYRTGGFVAHVYASRLFGFDRGFDVFEDFGLARPDYRLEAGLEPDAARVTDAALEWLRRQKKEPVFLLAHYFDPHWPYAAPGEDRDAFPSDYDGPLGTDYDSLSKYLDPRVPIPDDYRAFLINRYDGEIRWTDRQIGRLLDGIAAAGRGARAWVVLTADHGEEFKEHGSMGHGRQLYEEAIRVPLVIARAASGAAPPGGRDGANPSPDRAGADAPAAGPVRVRVPVGAIDLFPTVIDLAGAGVLPERLRGRSLAQFVAPGRRDSGPPPATAGAAAGAAPAGATAAGPADAHRTLVSETIRLNAYRKAVRQGPLKLHRFMDDNAWALYDLEADPQERRDLSEARADDARRLAQALFEEVDFLSGGWNLRWNSDGRKRRFEGWIRTDGVFRTVVPLFRERGKYTLRGGNVLTFRDDGQSGESGLSFTTAPYEARVEFHLTVDGRAAPERVFLGGERATPRRLPFSLAGDARSEAAFERPDPAAAGRPAYFLWRNRPAAEGQEVVLDDEIRARLRSLGYVD